MNPQVVAQEGLLQVATEAATRSFSYQITEFLVIDGTLPSDDTILRSCTSAVATRIRSPGSAFSSRHGANALAHG